MMPLNSVASPGATAPQLNWPGNWTTADDWDPELVLIRLYPDDRQREAIVAELETLTWLHYSLAQQAAVPDQLACLEERIFQLLGMA